MKKAKGPAKKAAAKKKAHSDSEEEEEASGASDSDSDGDGHSAPSAVRALSCGRSPGSRLLQPANRGRRTAAAKPVSYKSAKASDSESDEDPSAAESASESDASGGSDSE